MSPLLIVITATILVIIVWMLMSHSSNSLPDGTKLAQDPSFYVDHHAGTLDYLTSVYPAGKASLKRLTPKALAVFYNSLWFYYNCESAFDKILDRTTYCWKALPACGSADLPKLPYSPQGMFYSFRDWQATQTPWILSDSSRPPSYFSSGVPAGPFFFKYTGPAPLFLHQRTMFRATFPWGKQNEYPHISPIQKHWNFPKAWWKGVPAHGWVEVSSSNQPPGMALSVTVFWLNGCVGSGVFYNVGKTKIANNKVDAVWRLADELVKLPDGANRLKQVYNTSDPDQIILALLQNPCTQKGPKVWTADGKIRDCSWCSGGRVNLEVPKDANMWNGQLKYANVADWTKLCVGSEAWAECAKEMRLGTAENGEYPASRVSSQGSFDEAITWMGCYLGYDSVQMLQSANGSGFYQVEIMELRDLPAGTKNRDYSEFIEQGGSDCHSGDFAVQWRRDKYVEFFQTYTNRFFSRLTLRDPLDIGNDKSAIGCQQLPWAPDLNHQYNTVCMNNLSKMLARLNVFQPNQPYVFDQCEGNQAPIG